MQFGTAIANKQAIQMFLADSATEVQAAQWLVRHAAWLIDQGQPFTQAAAMAKLFAGRMAGSVTNKMVQVHGGAGFSAEYPIERYYRDARAVELVEGTSQMQQIVIAGGLLARRGQGEALGGHAWTLRFRKTCCFSARWCVSSPSRKCDPGPNRWMR